MKKNNKILVAKTLAVSFMLSLAMGPLTALAAGPAAVDLLTAANFVILSETGITNTGSHTSAIIGNIGSSPITAAAMNNVFCSEITGTIYGVDAAYTGSGATTCFAGNPGVPAVVPGDANKTLVDNAILDIGTAYTDAAGRTLPDFTNLYGGNLGGQTLAPGLYKWTTGVTIPTDVTLSGGAGDVWIFQISGDLSIASAMKVVLSGGAQASNVFWQVGGLTGATLGTYSTFNGNILTAKQIIIQTGAALNGRALAQTQVTLDGNAVSTTTPVVVVPPVVVPVPTPVVSSSGGSSGRSGGNNSRNAVSAPATTTVVTTVTSSNSLAATSTPTPTFPNTGFPEGSKSLWGIIVAGLVLAVVAVSTVLFLKKRSA